MLFRNCMHVLNRQIPLQYMQYFSLQSLGSGHWCSICGASYIGHLIIPNGIIYPNTPC